VFKVDVLLCPCGARRRVLAFLTDASQGAKILRHLGLDDRVPPLAPPRDLDAQIDLARRASDRDPRATDLQSGDAPSCRDLDAPFLPDPDPPAEVPQGGSLDPGLDPLPLDFADPPAPD
jgi:hypothetical protein